MDEWREIQEAQKRIDEAKANARAILNLSDLGLTDLPRQIEDLKNLTSLDLSFNRLTSVPREVFRLRGLNTLNLSNNHLTSVPKEIKLLSNLRKLHLRGNNLAYVPKEIGLLTGLKTLSLADSQIKDLPELLSRLPNLEALGLASCQISSLPDSIGELSQLRTLNLPGNFLRTLPNSLSNLKNLQTLNLGRNHLKSLPEFLGELSELRVLTLGSVEYEEYPYLKIYHWGLKTNENHFSFLPESMGGLSNLELLDLTYCQLADLPRSILDLPNLRMLFLHGNDGLGIPPELLGPTWQEIEEFERGEPNEEASYQVAKEAVDPQSILTFFFKIRSEPTRRLNEAKVILVGQGQVGKTSLVNRLLHGTYDPDERKTEGIKIHPWAIHVDGHDINLNVWDFGGQEIMHATHQFFLTKRSLYLLVLNSRDNRKINRVDYWLKMIESFGGGSPVIIVCNKCDEQPMDLDWKGLQRKFPTIKAFVREVSCQDNVGFDELSQCIHEEVGQLEHVGDKVPDEWFQVKDQLAQMKVAGMDCFPFEDYRHLCQKHGIERESDQNTLIEFLNDLGVMLHYGRHSVLTDLNILNPEWVTNGVYSIINKPELLRKRDGIVNIVDLQEILDSDKYPPSRHRFILEMMQKFEICFGFEGSHGEKFLLPDLLSEEEKDTGDWTDALAFKYHYDILPGSIITRFIVRMHPYISKNTYWRNGVVLVSEDGNNRALVKSDEDDGRISILIDGRQTGRRSFLEIIRADFRKIHASPARTGVEEAIPLPDNPKITVPYEHLRVLEKQRILEFVPEGTDKKYSVKALLDGIEDPSQRQREVHERTREEAFLQESDSRMPQSAPHPKSNVANIWGIGSFWLLALVVIVTVFGALNKILSWYAVPGVFLASLIALSLIGLLIAHNSGTLAEKGFLEALKDFYRSLRLLKNKNDS